MYKLEYHPHVIKFLKKIPRSQLQRIINKIELLERSLSNSNLDIKKLETRTPMYRLRIGKIRIIFSFDSKEKNIYLMKVNFRGSIYKK